MPRAIIYDLDGTISDSVRRGFLRFLSIARELKLLEIDQELAWERWGAPAIDIVRFFLSPTFQSA